MVNIDLGKTLISIGIFLVIIGILFTILSKVTGLPKLPGDIYVKKGNFSFYFPWVSSLVISVLLSLIFYLFFRK